MREQTTVVVNVEKRVKKLSAIGFIATVEIDFISTIEIGNTPKRVKAQNSFGLLKIIRLSFCIPVYYSIHIDKRAD